MGDAQDDAKLDEAGQKHKTEDDKAELPDSTLQDKSDTEHVGKANDDEVPKQKEMAKTTKEAQKNAEQHGADEKKDAGDAAESEDANKQKKKKKKKKKKEKRMVMLQMRSRRQ